MIKGWSAWRRKLPGYDGRQIVVLPMLVVATILLGQAYLLALESLPVRYPAVGIVSTLEAAIPLFGTISLLVAGYLSVTQMWRRRERYLAESPAIAYQRALPFGLLGIGLIFSTILNGFVPVYQLSHNEIHQPLAALLAAPLTGFGPGGWLLRGGFGFGVFALGTLHIVRCIETFGIDNAALVSLYYPEEAEMEDHDIYAVMRHPIYTGWLLWMAGGTLFRLSLYGFLEFGVFFAALVVWLRRVEELELVDRFGDSYREYRGEVPAFVPRPDSAGAYVAFLLGRD